MKTLIIGMGEVGRALYEVLTASVASQDEQGTVWQRPAHEVSTYDKTDEKTLILFQPTEVLNICFPYHDRFVENVAHYIDGTRPKLCIIHSTVPVGTTRKIQKEVPYTNLVHSPIHGQHPRLVEGIRTFVKYVGVVYHDDNAWIAASACNYLEAAGIKTAVVANAETSELSKLMCTAQTAMGILVEQEIHRLCQVHGAEFREVYTAWNLNYNEGYDKLWGWTEHKQHDRKLPDFSRPIYRHVPGPLGGHCLFQNAALIESWVTKAIREHGGIS